MSAGTSLSLNFVSGEAFSEFPTFKTNLMGGSSYLSETFKFSGNHLEAGEDGGRIRIRVLLAGQGPWIL